MKQCWAPDPAARPRSFDEVQKRLAIVLELLDGKGDTVDMDAENGNKPEQRTPWYIRELYSASEATEAHEQTNHGGL